MIFKLDELENKDKYLADLPKRISGLSENVLNIDTKDLLWIQWSNLKVMLPLKVTVEYYVESLNILAYMSFLIEEYSVKNMLKDSDIVKRILFEMKDYIFSDLNYFRR